MDSGTLKSWRAWKGKPPRPVNGLLSLSLYWYILPSPPLSLPVSAIVAAFVAVFFVSSFMLSFFLSVSPTPLVADRYVFTNRLKLPPSPLCLYLSPQNTHSMNTMMGAMSKP